MADEDERMSYKPENMQVARAAGGPAEVMDEDENDLIISDTQDMRKNLEVGQGLGAHPPGNQENLQMATTPRGVAAEGLSFPPVGAEMYQNLYAGLARGAQPPGNQDDAQFVRAAQNVSAPAASVDQITVAPRQPQQNFQGTARSGEEKSQRAWNASSGASREADNKRRRVADGSSANRTEEFVAEKVAEINEEVRLRADKASQNTNGFVEQEVARLEARMTDTQASVSGVSKDISDLKEGVSQQLSAVKESYDSLQQSLGALDGANFQNLKGIADHVQRLVGDDSNSQINRNFTVQQANIEAALKVQTDSFNDTVKTTLASQSEAMREDVEGLRWIIQQNAKTVQDRTNITDQALATGYDKINTEVQKKLDGQQANLSASIKELGQYLEQRADQRDASLSAELHGVTDHLDGQLAPLHESVETLKAQQAELSTGAGFTIQQQEALSANITAAVGRAIEGQVGAPVEERLKPVLGAIDEIRKQQNQASVETGRMANNMEKSVMLNEQILEQANQARDEARQMLEEARKERAAFAAERQMPVSDPKVLEGMLKMMQELKVGQQELAKGQQELAEERRAFAAQRQAQTVAVATSERSTPASGHVADMSERLDSVSNAAAQSPRPGQQRADTTDLDAIAASLPSGAEIARELASPAPSRDGVSIMQETVSSGAWVSEKWTTLKVPPERVAAAKALGVHEKQSQFGNKGMFYSVPPNTDLRPLQEFWTQKTRNEFAGRQADRGSPSPSTAPSASREASPAQKEGATPEVFSSTTWSTLKISQDQLAEANAVARTVNVQIREYPNDKGGTDYRVPPGTNLAPFKRYFSDDIQRKNNIHNLRIARDPKSATPASVFCSEGWTTLNVSPGQAEAARAAGVHEYDNKFKPGEKRYTVPPGTDLTPLKEYWTERTQRDKNVFDQHNSRCSGNVRDTPSRQSPSAAPAVTAVAQQRPARERLATGR